MLIDHPRWSSELAAWGKALPHPRAILVISAHWEASPLAHGATTSPMPLLYDFGGFPERFYRLTYPAPGNPGLVDRITALLGKAPTADPGRGLDHGAFIPLMLMYPGADIPVLQISLPTPAPKGLYDLGRRLAPLRDEGVLIFATGLLTHTFNIPDMSNPDAAPDPVLAHFDAWLGDALTRRDTNALLDYRTQAPGVRKALPTHEHFVPLFVALGAAVDDDAVTFPHHGFWFGNSMRSVQIG
ncbi:dioxygenase [Streptomyces nigrescens]|uniref:Dioxygenase n=1 Tax=Streptomyces nigrescens TaxID=1920 RepID=A0ABN6QVI2_STRNI|nr:class III extradiol ring-cleavage dioxygenase [Streptomyces nigrescens]BDM70184.1 dioxygenase [Streptomyces nigrescens]